VIADGYRVDLHPCPKAAQKLGEPAESEQGADQSVNISQRRPETR